MAPNLPTCLSSRPVQHFGCLRQRSHDPIRCSGNLRELGFALINTLALIELFRRGCFSLEQ